MNGVEMRSDYCGGGGMFTSESIALPAVSAESSLSHFASLESIEMIFPPGVRSGGIMWKRGRCVVDSSRRISATELMIMLMVRRAS